MIDVSIALLAHHWLRTNIETLQITYQQRFDLESRVAEYTRPLPSRINARVQSWWRMTGSNRRPPACKAGALPAELIPQGPCAGMQHLVGLVGFEPTTPALSRRCSNQLSYRPKPVTRDSPPTRSRLLPGHAPLATSLQQPISVSVRAGKPVFQKGGDPAAPSDTATLLRLHPSHEPCRGNRPPCG